MNQPVDRRRFLTASLAAASAGALSSLSPLASLGAAPAGSGRRKNVLFVILDDMRPLLGCYGQRQVISPNIDRLARQSVVFDNAQCQYPVCNPSRLSCLTGLRPDHTNCYDNNTVWPKFDKPVPSVFRQFKDHGYATLSVGKVYHQPMWADLDAFTEKPVCLSPYNYARPDNVAKEKEIARDGAARGLKYDDYREKMLVAATEDAEGPDDIYNEGKHTAMATGYLRKYRDKPFLLAVGYFRPHMPFLAPKKYWDLYDPAKIKLAANHFLPTNGLDLPMHDNFEPKVYGDIPKVARFDDATERRLMHGYLACVSYVDAQVGKLVAELESLGIADDTTIIVWGDNGFHLGEHNLWGKFTTFEESARCPLIVHVPGMTDRGRVSAPTAELIDIYPTACALAGVPLPSHLDGRSLVPVLTREDPKRDGCAFTQFLKGEAMGYSMRTPTHRYTRWIDTRKGKLLGEELYDHRSDPAENRNLALDAAMAPLCKELAARLAATCPKSREASAA